MSKSYFIDEEKSELHKPENHSSERNYIENEKEDQNWSFVSSSTSSHRFHIWPILASKATACFASSVIRSFEALNCSISYLMLAYKTISLVSRCVSFCLIALTKSVILLILNQKLSTFPRVSPKSSDLARQAL